MIDEEILRLVQSIERGAIRDPDRVRSILNSVRKTMEDECDNLMKIKGSLDAASEAFLHGWEDQGKNEPEIDGEEWKSL